MYYTNKEIFVLSAVGCMDTEPDGLESILAGNEEGAKGCCLSVDMTADGIAVLSSDGYCVANDGTRLSITDYSYAELHQAAPQLVPAGQAIELARTCRAKIAITVHNQTLLPQLRITLRHSEWLDNTIFVGLGLVEAARIAVANPDLHIMGELPALPDNIDALVRAALNAADLAGAREMVCQVPTLYPTLSAVGFVKSDKGMGIQIREFFNHPCSHP